MALFGGSKWKLLAACSVIAIAMAVCLFHVAFRPNRILTRVDAVRQLSPRVCRNGYSVRIRGVATDVDRESFVLNDGSGGLRFELANAGNEIEWGVSYEASGIAGYNQVTPLVRVAHLRPLESRIAPKTTSVTLSDLYAGGYEDQSVEVGGKVVDILSDNISGNFEIESGGRRVLLVDSYFTNTQRKALEGRPVRIRAVVRGRYTADARLLAPELRRPVLQSGIDIPRGEMVPSPVSSPPRLVSIGDIRKLPPDKPARTPALVRAVVTYYDWDRYKLFVQDATGAMYITRPAHPIPELRAGVAVRVEGAIAGGEFSPIIETTAIRVLGPGRMPDPIRLPPDEVVSGRFDSEWVELDGQVRSLARNGSAMVARLQYLTEKLILTVPVGGLAPVPQGLVGATVRVHGVYGVLQNENRQLVGVNILVPGWEYVKVLGRTHGETNRERSIRSLQQFSPWDSTRQRVSVRGIVTAALPDSVFVQDATGALAVFPAEAPTVQPGDRVSAVGYISTRGLRLALEDAEIRLTGRGAVAPAEVVPGDVMQGRFHHALVRIEGYVVESDSRAGDDVVILEAGRRLFTARLPRTPAVPFSSPAKGDLLEVTGICMPNLRLSQDSSYGSVETVGFELLARTQGDLKVVRRASWWTLERTALVLITMTLAALAALAWVVLLRRRVSGQTATIRSQLTREASLKEAAQAASRAKGDFLANMSHEIRTPLHGILGMADMAIEAPTGPEQREYLEMVKQCGSSLLALVSDILDLSKIEAGCLALESEPFQVRELVEGSCRILAVNAKLKGLSLNCRIDDAVPFLVLGDPGRLRQVLVNLVGNAAKFTQEGGIEVCLYPESITGESALLHFRVSDTGPGIPKDKLEVIYGAFEQVDGSSQRGGTGLGLAITRQLVRLMGGETWAESVLGEGSTFHFTARFPIFTGESTVLPAEIRTRDHELPELRVLVADDNSVNRCIAVRMLEKRGHQVVAVADGQEAVEAVRQARYDVVLMDVRMPVLDGLSATRRIREIEAESGAHVPIVALTAQAMKEDADVCKQAGMDAFLTKPIRIDDLLRLLEQLLPAEPTIQATR